LLANTTRLRAGGPAGPARNPAVDRAYTDSAGTFLGCRRASLTTVASGCENITGALLVALTTGLVTSGPGTKLFHHAIHRASFFVASNFFFGDATEVATELSLGDNLAGAGHGTAAARY